MATMNLKHKPTNFTCAKCNITEERYLSPNVPYSTKCPKCGKAMYDNFKPVYHKECGNIALLWDSKIECGPGTVISALAIKWPDGKQAKPNEALLCGNCGLEIVLLADGTAISENHF